MSLSESSIYLYVKILAVIGIGLACYLLFEQITHSPFQPCNINATVNCNAVISGEVSKTFGIPTPLIGLTGYIIILISSFLKKKRLILGMAAFGLVFCLSIAYIELIRLKVVCPVCIGCQVDMITVFVLSLVLNLRRNDKESNN
jgi:uncharacterized membrane protein